MGKDLVSTQFTHLPAGWSAEILDSIAEGVFTVDRNWTITWFNKAAEKITGFSRDEAIGASCSDVFRSTCCEKGCVLAETFSTEQTIVGKQVQIVRSDGEVIPIVISTAILRNAAGEIIGGVETFRDLSEVTKLRTQLQEQNSHYDIISRNQQMLQIFKLLPRIAPAQVTVLIRGASGTGKELLAQAIHNASGRDKDAFHAINCAAIPSELLETELFGHKKGAFTGAHHDKPGLFQLADQGTLFLDEVGDLPLPLQAKMLRVIAEQKFTPLGDVKDIEVNVRLLAATNRDLEVMVQEGTFREDLYYRLNVIQLSLPSLLDRKEDIPLLIEHFLCRFSRQNGRQVKQLKGEALQCLLKHHWPGNVRELANAMEHAVVLSAGEYIGIEDLPVNLTLTWTKNRNPVTLEEIEKQAIYQSLVRNNWRVMQTSRELGIHKNTLRRKMLKFQLTD
jgi:PAS domain S-box-containing protein